jgi:hypothetical protein
MRQPEGQAVYKLRKQTVERQFADLKQHRSLRQFASFGLRRARIQVGLLVLGGRKKITGPHIEALIVEYRPCSFKEAEPWKSQQGCATC